MNCIRMVGLCSLTLIAACGGDAIEKRSIAIAPGYIQMESGQKLQVVGFQACPTTGHLMIGTVQNLAMRNACTIIEKDADWFNISVGTARGIADERWSVVADSESLSLVRPNGDKAILLRRAK